jgi:hypothetical protein
MSFGQLALVFLVSHSLIVSTAATVQVSAGVVNAGRG